MDSPTIGIFALEELSQRTMVEFVREIEQASIIRVQLVKKSTGLRGSSDFAITGSDETSSLYAGYKIVLNRFGDQGF
jgi:hypothetical protein